MAYVRVSADNAVALLGLNLGWIVTSHHWIREILAASFPHELLSAAEPPGLPPTNRLTIPIEPLDQSVSALPPTGEPWPRSEVSERGSGNPTVISSVQTPSFSPLLSRIGMLRAVVRLLNACLLIPLPLALAPMQAAQAAGNTAATMQRYVSDSRQPLGSQARFMDVQPSDWAYQALINLFERHSCLTELAGGGFAGGKAISRFQAAALLNACLARISQGSNELNQLLSAFERELAVLRGRVDGLEARVGELEATSFSTTTALSGQATFVLGANRFSGSDSEALLDSRQTYGATTVNYDLALNLDTSFSGKDLLRTTLRAGNFARSSFGGAGPTPLSQLEVAFQEDCGTKADCGDVLAVDRLFYQVSRGDFRFSLGGRIGQDDMLAIWPSVYPAETVLDVLSLPGAPGAYNRNLGAGAGLWWQRDGLAISVNYVAANGDESEGSAGGIGTAGAGASGTVQIGYSQERWGLAAIYSRLQNGNDLLVYGTSLVLDSASQPGVTSAYGLAGFWQPQRSGWLPSISAGWGLNHSSYANAMAEQGLVSTSQSWSVGLQWLDVIAPGHALGMAVGQPPFATDRIGGETVADGNWVWEWWLKLQLSDNISVTPALFYLSRPLGQETPAGGSFQQLGALLKTSVRF